MMRQLLCYTGRCQLGKLMSARVYGGNKLDKLSICSKVRWDRTVGMLMHRRGLEHPTKIFGRKNLRIAKATPSAD